MKEHLIAIIALVFLLPKQTPAEIHYFSEADNQSKYQYELVGKGNDAEMLLKIKKNTPEQITMIVSAGTILIPDDSTVQRMVVRQKVRFTMDTDGSIIETIPVVGMDIDKQPPIAQNKQWRIGFQKDLHQLITFVLEVADQFIQGRADTTEINVEDFILSVQRFTLWRYQGASQEEINNFLKKYVKGVEIHQTAYLIETADRIVQTFRDRYQ